MTFSFINYYHCYLCLIPAVKYICKYKIIFFYFQPIDVTVIDNLYVGSYEKINAWSVTRLFDLLMTHNNAVHNIHTMCYMRQVVWSVI